MKLSLAFFILAIAALAPHINEWVAIALGVWFLCMAIYCMLRDE